MRVRGNNVHFERSYWSEFELPVWERAWVDFRRHFSFAEGFLARQSAYSGFGIRNPFAIHCSPGGVYSRCVGEGSPLGEMLMLEEISQSEDSARGIVEQVCFGLHRLHLGLGRAHGAVSTFNIAVTSKGRAYLWSGPQGRLEAFHTPLQEQDQTWEVPFRALEATPGREPSVGSDIFALGQVLLRLLPPEMAQRCRDSLHRSLNPPDRASRESSHLVDIFLNTQRLIPGHRYQSALDLALAVNPDTRLRQLEVGKGKERLIDGLRLYALGRYEEAEEHWQDGVRHDWLSVGLWNNLAVCRMRERRWHDALDPLERARGIDPYHPMVLCNLAFCHLCQGDLAAADNRSAMVLAMRNDLLPALLVRSNVDFRMGSPGEAIEWAKRARAFYPEHRGARWQLMRLFQKQGRDNEATWEESALEELEYRVPYFDHLIDDTRDPPWGAIRKNPPDFWLDRIDQDPPPENPPDDTGSRVPLYPRPPGPGAQDTIPQSYRREGLS